MFPNHAAPHSLSVSLSSVSSMFCLLFLSEVRSSLRLLLFTAILLLISLWHLAFVIIILHRKQNSFTCSISFPPILILTIVFFPLLIFSAFGFLMFIHIPYSLYVVSSLSIIACVDLSDSSPPSPDHLQTSVPSALIHLPPTFIPSSRSSTASRTSSSIYMLHISGESGHSCLTPLPTFPGSKYKYSPSILTRIFYPMCFTGFLLVFCLSKRFPSISEHVTAFSILPCQMLFHNPQNKYIHPDHSGFSSLLVPLMFLMCPYFPNPF